MPKFSIKLLILVVYTACTFNLCAQTKLDTFKIKGANDEVMMNYYKFYEDKSNNKTVENIIQQFNIGNFKRLNKGSTVFNSSYTKSSFWFVLAIKNDTTVALPLLWSFYNNNIGFVLYNITNLQLPKFIDSLYPSKTLNQREIPVRSLALKFSLLPNEYELFLVKVYKINNDAMYFPSDLSTTEDVLLWENGFAFIFGRYAGYIFFVFVLNVFLWVILKARIHFWHALYIYAILLYSLSENMFDVIYLPNWIYTYVIKIPKMNFLGFALLFSIIVMQIFVQLKIFASKINIFLNNLKRLLLVVNIGLFIFSLILKPQNFFLCSVRVINDILSFACIVCIVAVFLFGIMKKNRFVIAYIIATICLLLAFFDFILANIFDIHLFYFRPGNITIGVTIEITLLSVFFVMKLQRERKENYLSLKQKSIENEELNKELINIQEEERKRIASDLHDDLGGTLSTLKLLISNTEINNKQQLLQLADKAVEDVRNLSHNIMPKEILETGFYNYLNDFIHLLNQQNNTKFSLITVGNEQFISHDKAIIILRIINETCFNIIKHAIASQAQLQVIADNENLQIIVEDNGIGFSVNNNTKGIGLKSIKTRVAYLKGNFYIESNNNGTIIIIDIPLH